MRNSSKLQLFSLWHVDPHHEGKEQDLLTKLKHYLRAAGAYLSATPPHNELILKQRMSLKDALASLCPQLGMGLLEFYRFDSEAFLVGMPLLACNLNKDFVLLLPNGFGEYQLFKAVGQKPEHLKPEEISQRFLCIVGLFRKADYKKPLNLAHVNSCIASYMPKMFVALASALKIALGAVVLTTLALVFRKQFAINVFALAQLQIACFIGLFLIEYFIARCRKNWPLIELWSLSALYGRAFSQNINSYQSLSWRDLLEQRAMIKDNLRNYFLTNQVLIWIFLFGNLALLWFLEQPAKALGLLLFFGLLMLVARRLNRSRERLINDERELQHELDSALNSLEKSFSMAASLKAQDHLLNRQGQLCFRLQEIRLKLSLQKAIKFHATWILPFFVMALSLTMSFAISDFALRLLLVIDALFIGRACAELLAGRTPTGALAPEVVDKLNSMQGYAGHKLVPTDLAGSLELIRVSFAYPDSSMLLFNNLSLSIKAGYCYGIFGPSGSGKSTLLKLLMGFYETKSGYIIIDGQDIQSLNLSALRKHFGYVGQNSRLFSGSISQNIIAGRSISQQTVIDLALSHPIFDVLLDLPMGLETFVFARSFHLSQVQINIILLARAIIHKPKILFLDEIMIGMGIKEQNQLAEYLASLSLTRILVSHHPIPKALQHEALNLDGVPRSW